MQHSEPPAGLLAHQSGSEWNYRDLIEDATEVPLRPRVMCRREAKVAMAGSPVHIYDLADRGGESGVVSQPGWQALITLEHLHSGEAGNSRAHSYGLVVCGTGECPTAATTIWENTVATTAALVLLTDVSGHISFGDKQTIANQWMIGNYEAPAGTVLSKAAAPAAALEAKWKRISAQLEMNGAEGGLPDLVIADAKAAATELSKEGIRALPTVGDASDGDLSLLWDDGPVVASLSFQSNGSFLGYAYAPGDKGPWSIEADSFTLPALRPLIKALKQL